MPASDTREIYADHAATTAPAPEVVAAMAPYLGDAFGNPSSVHRRGEAAREAIESARADVATLIQATPEEIVFTATGSEANDLALTGVMEAAALDAGRGTAAGRDATGRERGAARRRIVVSAIEHLSVLESARYLESRGFDLTIVPVDSDGLIDLARLRAALTPDVALVSVMLVNNEIGTIQPITEIAGAAHAAGAKMHCDAIQGVGKIPVGVDDLGVDLLSLAGHKFHGPLGAAALYVRRRTRLVPQIHGGHQERSRRAGTENLPAIVGLGAAARRARAALAAGANAAINALGDRLLDQLIERIPGARLNGARDARIQGIVNVCFAGVDGEAVLHELDREGITVSTGSACSAAAAGPSHVLIALGLRPEDAHASVRFSLGEGSIESDVDRIVAVTASTVERLRSLGADDPATRMSRASA
ncbi:MAG: cysteine desulfurase [Candidatus Eisenbacteria bacterium]|uniref:cysteine desulfurase n=1 Tax=Eiseniibacteriota bacterium TaxID=2212470 RepID=A0A9D6L7V2_UNCEI|nr:cysteine desulfurase [Candidatus Eisenbacteria bacterium]MBI3540341.1 cysteine desulfurase [Candidatus Eisenbacteria bacterium]